jgi:hypothetical protein
MPVTPVLDTDQKTLKTIEGQRRGREYGAMNKSLAALFTQLRDDTSRSGHYVRACAYYERHMAEYQQAMDSRDAIQRATLLEISRASATLSLNEAKLAEDPVGELYALMNISGLILPAQLKHFAAWNMSVKTFQRAAALYALEQDAKECRRILNLMMNITLHRLKMQVEHFKIGEKIEELLVELGQNPFYEENKGQEWMVTIIASAQEFLDR